MTEPWIVPPQTMRIFGRDDVPESYIPLTSRIVGDRVVAPEAFIPRLDFPRPAPPTEAEMQEREAERARREAAREAEMQARIDRHTALVKHHAESPVITALLSEHGPHAARWAGQTVQECHGCPSYWEDTIGEEAHYEWPCPTWTAIAEQTESGA